MLTKSAPRLLPRPHVTSTRPKNEFWSFSSSSPSSVRLCSPPASHLPQQAFFYSRINIIPSCSPLLRFVSSFALCRRQRHMLPQMPRLGSRRSSRRRYRATRTNGRMSNKWLQPMKLRSLTPPHPIPSPSFYSNQYASLFHCDVAHGFTRLFHHSFTAFGNREKSGG